MIHVFICILSIEIKKNTRGYYWCQLSVHLRNYLVVVSGYRLTHATNTYFHFWCQKMLKNVLIKYCCLSTTCRNSVYCHRRAKKLENSHIYMKNKLNLDIFFSQAIAALPVYKWPSRWKCQYKNTIPFINNTPSYILLERPAALLSDGSLLPGTIFCGISASTSRVVS